MIVVGFRVDPASRRQGFRSAPPASQTGGALTLGLHAKWDPHRPAPRLAVLDFRPQARELSQNRTAKCTPLGTPPIDSRADPRFFWMRCAETVASMREKA